MPLTVADVLGLFVSGAPLQGKGLTAGGLSGGVPGLTTALQGYMQNHPDAGGGHPRAYINWVLFDDQFRYVSGGADPVGAANAVKTHNNSTIPNIDVIKNGYIFVFCSNETQTQEVFFDNLQVLHSHGPLTEETHYYPFGLTMAGISSKALNAGGNDINCGCPNKKGFNGNELQSREFSDGSGLEVYDFNARTYDQQIGRFIQIDPLNEDGGQESLTPFQFGLNNPVRYNDPDGKCPMCIPFVIEGLKILAIATISYMAGKATHDYIKEKRVQNQKDNSSDDPVKTEDPKTKEKTENKTETPTRSASDQKLIDDAKKAQEKKDKQESPSENRQNQTKKGNQKQGKSNQTTRGSHDSGNQNSGSRNMHEKADARTAREQRAADKKNQS